ncbi:MAG: ABC transporter ATP-binding protein [Melioribacteraceae bacterium]|nr:ABC transporter ATP-binding protein [Melioribacteraceae bacterium]MCF8353820.1 ABC transporter ATP-binding protein [Melioribacteraceae bacterium]MCF8393656.1 ABC transporter ATP-binding protein [Melioribacteraceae bacterium]MCF8419466.1 ABC transporter ATP-binding protein [Melioribacteraceae bacterium]
MNKYFLELNKVTKTFGRRLVFKDINFTLESGKVYGLSGPNGSGKSTLAKIIAKIISTTTGKVIHRLNGEEIISEKLHDHLGFVSPYLVLYDEFSAQENLYHFAKIRGIDFDADYVKHLFEEFDLYDRRLDLMKGYSSGMKQRIKFIFALQHSPELLILDEPTSNLDQKGKEKVYQIIKEQAKDNLVIIASNEENDLALCDQIIQITEYKNINSK